jgi:hypothetical protein
LKCEGRKAEAKSMERLVKANQPAPAGEHLGQYTIDVAELRASRDTTAGK